MFIPRAHVHLEHVFYKRSRSRTIYPKPQQKITFRDLLFLPCLVPTIVSMFLGCALVIGGVLMSVVGYNPAIFTNFKFNNVSNAEVGSHHSAPYSALNCLTFIGPILMGIGFFVLIVAVVMYCEFKDKFFGIITPIHNVKDFTKTELYHMVIREFRRNYFRGVEVPLRKPPPPEKTATEKSILFQALGKSTQALLLTPCKWLNVREKQLTLNYKPMLKRNFRSQDSWLRTSSLPNIGQHSQSSNIKGSRHKTCTEIVNSMSPAHGSR